MTLYAHWHRVVQRALQNEIFMMLLNIPTYQFEINVVLYFTEIIFVNIYYIFCKTYLGSV